jgi:hypothetical protein
MVQDSNGGKAGRPLMNPSPRIGVRVSSWAQPDGGSYPQIYVIISWGRGDVVDTSFTDVIPSTI